MVIVFCTVFLNIKWINEYRGASCDGPKTFRSCNAYTKELALASVEKRIEFKILLIR